MLTNILQYLEHTAGQKPNKTAFSDGTNDLTFSDLLFSSRRIGASLLSRGFEGGAVAILMERAPYQIAAFFGVIYAGGFYVPLDGSMPDKRIESIFGSACPQFVIADEKNREKAEAFGVPILLYDQIAAGTIEKEDETRLREVRENQIDVDPIYIVFTSGSTGVPKGVVACHRSVIDYAESLCEALPFDEETVFGNQTPLFFDAPLKEILPTIKYGATTYLIPKKLFSFPMLLCNFLNDHRVNTVCWVVSALTMISSFGLLTVNPPRYLCLVCFGSEVFPRSQYDLWRAAYPDIPFYNLYGPTEATGMSCYWRADRNLKENEPIPVGKPFRNTAVLLLSEQGVIRRTAPIGEDAERGFSHGPIGEIAMRGTCVTLGYYRDFERTDAAFIPNPVQKAYREIIYRTGDLGAYNEYGELVFLSRADSQIKLMGHRIELGEIEEGAMRVQGIRQAAAIFDPDEKRILLAYAGDKEPNELAKGLKEYLPRYMLPSEIRKFNRLPLTPNGKLDRRSVKNEMLPARG